MKSIVTEHLKINEEANQYYELDDRRQVLNTIVVKNELYAQTDKVQEDMERIRQITEKWRE